VLYTVAKQTRALVLPAAAAREEACSRHCVSTAAEVICALMASLILSSSARWSVRLAMRRQLAALRHMIAAIFPWRQLAVVEARYTERWHWRQSKAVMVSLLLSYPVLAFTWLSQLYTLLSAVVAPHPGGSCATPPARVLTAIAAALVLGLTEHALAVGDMTRRVDACRRIVRELFPPSAAAILEARAATGRPLSHAGVARALRQEASSSRSALPGGSAGGSGSALAAAPAAPPPPPPLASAASWRRL
jgi:hypothetical protein